MFKKMLMLAAVLVIGATAPASAQYPEIVVNPGSITPGGSVSVSGKYCNPNENVTVTLRPVAAADRALPAEGIVVATTVANEEGEFNTSFNVPADATPGSYEVVVNCGGTERIVPIEVLSQNVTPPSTPPTTPGGGGNGSSGGSGSGELPRTGSDLNGFGLVGAGLLTAGGLFLLGARKRRSAAV